MTTFKAWADAKRAELERDIILPGWREWPMVILAAEDCGTEGASQQNPIDPVIDQLERRLVPAPDRTRLRKALDTADAPLAGRAGQDQALGRIAGR